MSVNLKVTLGTVNYTDWLHVTANLVSDPAGTPAWQDWIDVPVSNYNFVIPNLQPANYYIRYYDAPTDVALGTLVAELLVNALTGETIYERRFYTVGGPGLYDPAVGATEITDPYLEGKTITGILKESFRYLKDDEFTFDDPSYTIEVLIGGTFALNEVVTVEIRHNASSNPPVGSGGLYTGTITVTAASETLLAADINKRVRLKGSAAAQAITLCSLSSIADGDGFYFDNSVGGVSRQVKLILPGIDKILYNGFKWPSNLFAEFWVDEGDHLKIERVTDGVDVRWEVIADYSGRHVGKQEILLFKDHGKIIPNNRALIDGDEFPKLWYWVNSILPATHKYTTTTVTDAVFIETDAIKARSGQFMVHPTLKKMRMPNGQLWSLRGLADFNAGGTDVANRPVDYPGGTQAEMIGPHSHPLVPQRTGDIDRGNQASLFSLDTTGNTGLNTGTENRVKNIGVIFGTTI